MCGFGEEERSEQKKTGEKEKKIHNIAERGAVVRICAPSVRAEKEAIYLFAHYLWWCLFGRGGVCSLGINGPRNRLPRHRLGLNSILTNVLDESSGKESLPHHLPPSLHTSPNPPNGLLPASISLLVQTLASAHTPKKTQFV